MLPPFEDVLVPSEVDVGGREVTKALVEAPVIVVLYEGTDRFERLERNRLVSLRRGVDQQRQRDDVLGCTAAALSRERAVEPLGVTPGRIVLELGLLPVMFEGRFESLDDLGVLGRADAHVPFEAFDLC